MLGLIAATERCQAPTSVPEQKHGRHRKRCQGNPTKNHAFQGLGWGRNHTQCGPEAQQIHERWERCSLDGQPTQRLVRLSCRKWPLRRSFPAAITGLKRLLDNPASFRCWAASHEKISRRRERYMDHISYCRSQLCHHSWYLAQLCRSSS